MAYVFKFENGQNTFVICRGESDESTALRQAWYQVGREAEDYSGLEDKLAECSSFEELKKFSFYTDVRSYGTKVTLSETKEISNDDYNVICRHAEILGVS